MVTLDIDTLRFLLVAAVAVGFVVYATTHLSAGGVFTGGYIVILILIGEWLLIASVIFTAAVALYVIRRYATRFIALPKVWTFFGLTLTSALVMSALTLASQQLGPVLLPGDLELVLIAGSYITPGLIAYDVAHQGLRKTMLGLSLVMLGTVIVVLPVIALADALHPLSTTAYVTTFGAIPQGMYWLIVLAAVLFSGALRLTFGLRSGGFIGAVFMLEMYGLIALMTIVLAALAAAFIASLLARFIVMSPRQEFHLALLIGMMSAWTSLYWAAEIGWEPALAANAFALQPLLAVGLLAADMRRPQSGFIQPIIGVALTLLFLFAVLYSATGSGPIMWGTTFLLLVGVPALMLVPGVRELRNSWSSAERAGRKVAEAVANGDERSR